MKIKRIKKLARKLTRKIRKRVPKGVTTKVHSVDGVVTLTHSQHIKQSMNYQSMEVGYAATAKFKDTPKDIEKGSRSLERLIEDVLVPKFQEQRSALKALALEGQQ